MEKYIVSPRDPTEPLPEVVVFYTPQVKYLSIQAGSPVRIHESESTANYMVAHYDKGNRLVALDLDGAENALEPLIEAARHPDETQPGTITKKSSIFLNSGPNSGDPVEDVFVFYTPETQKLRIQANDPVIIHTSQPAAQGMTAHYNENGSLVALDLENAQLLLKPFLDAALNREKEKAA